MGGGCCGGSCGTGRGASGPGFGGPHFGGPKSRGQADFRRILGMAFVLNALMAAVALGTGIDAQSMALQALALVLLANAANHGASLWLAGRTLDLRAWANLARGLLLGGFGLWVLGSALWNAHSGGMSPNPWPMAMVGLMALSVATAVGMQLFAGRRGKPTLRTVWLCVRRDALACLAVAAAAAGVGMTGQDWPDGLVGAIIAGLSLPAAGATVRQAVAELRAYHGSPSAPASGEGA